MPNRAHVSALTEEAALERQQDALNAARNLVEDSNNWLALHRLDFAKSYVEGNLEIALRLSVGADDGHIRPRA